MRLNNKIDYSFVLSPSLPAALHISQDGPASADEFLPSIIFMIIYTSPQHLHSDVKLVHLADE